MSTDGEPSASGASFAWLTAFLQTSDALFPTGAYAHSLGFEEIVRLGSVRDEATLKDFLLRQIAPALAHQELPYLRYAFEAAALGDLPELCALDREISAWKLARETRDASVQIGVRRLRALQAITGASLYSAFDQCLQRGEARGHHLIVCAVQAVTEGIPLQAALHAWHYQTTAAICSAALKLIRIGQDGCQRALRAAAGRAEQTIADSLAVARHEAGWFNPLIEIASMRHEFAEERLFIS
jgi:urease accessory protein